MAGANVKKTVFVLLELDYDVADAEREGVTEQQIVSSLVDVLAASNEQDFRGRLLTAEQAARLAE